jgi:signal transduction histidine kinase
VGKGTGLGLAVAHGIVREHVGWIEIESRVEHGTRVTVFLPLAQAEGMTDWKEIRSA